MECLRIYTLRTTFGQQCQNVLIQPLGGVVVSGFFVLLAQTWFGMFNFWKMLWVQEFLISCPKVIRNIKLSLEGVVVSGFLISCPRVVRRTHLLERFMVSGFCFLLLQKWFGLFNFSKGLWFHDFFILAQKCFRSQLLERVVVPGF